MRVIFTCGGTAGHVNPALALVGYMREKQPDLQVLFVGTPNGMEKDLVTKAGYDFKGVDVSNFHRDIKEIKHNLHTVNTLNHSISEAIKIIKEFQPDLVVGTGGYASFPVIYAAARGHVPTAVHESNMIPGLTTKMLERYSDRIMVGFEECKAHYRDASKVIVTGTPCRGDFFDLTKEEAKEKLGLTDGRKLVVSFWGSLGASTMNEKMLSFFSREQEDEYPFYHIHGFGKKSYAELHETVENLQLSKDVDVREYIYDMAVVMRAADLVISRSGASTISELTALGMPAIMVPSPFVVANHQEKNARILEDHGGAVVLLENDISGEDLYQTTLEILNDSNRLDTMAKNMATMGILDALERIYQTCMSIVK